MNIFICFRRAMIGRTPFADYVIEQKRVSTYLWRKSLSNYSSISHFFGPRDQPLLDLSVGDVIRRAAQLFGEEAAVFSRHQNIRKTFSQVDQESSSLAAGFLALGFQQGDRIGVWGPNSYEWYLTKLAAAKAGLILVNVNPAYKPMELKYCINKVSMKGIVFPDEFKNSNYYEMLCEVAPELPESKPGLLCSKSVPTLSIPVTMSSQHFNGLVSWRDVQQAGESSHEKKIQQLSKEIKSKDPFNIQFTSGTTGLPKGALLSHYNVVNNAYFIGQRCGYTEKRMRICLPVPLHHCFGNVAGVLSAALFGCCIVFPSEGFNATEIVKTFEEEKINSCYGTPTMFVDIVNEYKRTFATTPDLHCGIMAGAPCPEHLVNQLLKELRMKDFTVMFGMTETSPVTLQCFPSDSPHIRTSTVGCPSDWVEVKLVDENENTVPIGSTGELLVRGYCNFMGYWDDDEKTKQTITSDGWLKTGDLMSFDERGYGSVKGRIKDVIIRGGENIYPAEVEAFYMTHPGILEAQVYGVPDERMGEEVAMCLRLKPNSSLKEDDIKHWSKGKISHFKIPRYISMRAEFPVTPSGKIQKFKLKEMTMKEFSILKAQ